MHVNGKCEQGLSLFSCHCLKKAELTKKNLCNKNDERETKTETERMLTWNQKGKRVWGT